MTLVLLDVDGVLADFVASYLRLVYEITGAHFEHHHVTQFDLKRALGLSDKAAADIAAEIQRPGFCAGIEPLAGAADGIRALTAIADVYIVTSPWNSNPTWTYDREKWLARHFGIHHSRVIHTSAKHLVAGDVLIDDRFETCCQWRDVHPGKTPILWEAPWNRDAAWAGVCTNDWARLCRLVEAVS